MVHSTPGRRQTEGKGRGELEVSITRGARKHFGNILYLDVPTAGAQEAQHSGRDRHGSEQAEAASLPHLLHVVVSLEIHSDAMHSVAGDSGHCVAPSRGSAQAV